MGMRVEWEHTFQNGNEKKRNMNGKNRNEGNRGKLKNVRIINRE